MRIGHYMQPDKWVTFCGISYEKSRSPVSLAEQEICWRIPWPNHGWSPKNIAFKECKVCREKAALAELAKTDL